MESVKIAQNKETISDKDNNVISPSVNFPKDNPSSENGNLSQNNPSVPKGADDKKDPNLPKSKKKKKNARKGKNKDSVAAPQNEAKDEIKSHDSEPEKPGELEIDSEKEELKNFKTEVLLDQPSTVATQEGDKTDPTTTQIQTPVSKDDAINTEASETKTLEPSDLGTKTSKIADVSTITIPENSSISLSNVVPMVLESKPQNTPPNPDGSSEILICNPVFANNAKQDEFKLQERSQSIKEFSEYSKLKNSRLVASSTNELVKENADFEPQALTNNLVSETGDFKAISDSSMAETPLTSLIEDNVASISLKSESCPLVQEKTSSELLRDADINQRTSEATEKIGDSITSLVESGVESTSKFILNVKDEIVKNVDSNLSTINLGKLIKGSNFQEPELSSSSQLEETDMRFQVEQQITGNTRDDNNETGIIPVQNSNELADIASELQNVHNQIQMVSSNNLSETNTSVNDEISEIRNLSDNTIVTSENVNSRDPGVSSVARHIVQPEFLRSETSAVIEGNIFNDKEIDITESPPLAPETAVFITSLTDFKKSNEETESTKKNSKETIDSSSHSFEPDKSNATECKIIGSDEIEVSEPFGDISANKEILEIQSNYIESAQNESSCLCNYSQSLKQQDKELNSVVLKDASDTEETSPGPQDHSEFTTKETFQSENWKKSLESTVGKAKSLIDNEVSQASNRISMLRHSKSEFLNSEIVNTTPLDSKNDETHGQNLAQFSKIEGESSEKNLSNTIHSDSEVEILEVKRDEEVSVISPMNDVLGSDASLAEIANKTKLKFKPSVGEQALAPELVTISKETLDLLYKRLDSMQLEIERLSSALNIQNKTTSASTQDKSDRSLKDDYVISESSQQNSKIIEEEIVNTNTLKKPSKNKFTTKSSCIWRLMSIFGYKNITKSEAGLVTRSVSDNLLSPSRGSKGKGKEIIAQANKPSSARTYKVIGRVRAKHDLS